MSKYEFRYLSQEDILSLNIPYEDVIDAVEKVMSEFGKGTCQLWSWLSGIPPEYVSAWYGNGHLRGKGRPESCA